MAPDIFKIDFPLWMLFSYTEESGQSGVFGSLGGVNEATSLCMTADGGENVVRKACVKVQLLYSVSLTLPPQII